MQWTGVQVVEWAGVQVVMHMHVPQLTMPSMAASDDKNINLMVCLSLEEMGFVEQSWFYCSCNYYNAFKATYP